MRTAAPYVLVGLCALLLAAGVLMPWVGKDPTAPPAFEAPPDPAHPEVAQARAARGDPELRLGTPTAGRTEDWWSGMSPAFLGRWTFAIGLAVAAAMAVLGTAAVIRASWSSGILTLIVTTAFAPAAILTVIDVAVCGDLTEPPRSPLHSDYGLMVTLLASLLGTVLAIRAWGFGMREREPAPPPPVAVFE